MEPNSGQPLTSSIRTPESCCDKGLCKYFALVPDAVPWLRLGRSIGICGDLDDIFLAGVHILEIRRKTGDGEDMLNLEIYVRISGGSSTLQFVGFKLGC